MAVTTFNPLTIGVAGAVAPGETNRHAGSTGATLLSVRPVCTAFSRSARLPWGAWAPAVGAPSDAAAHTNAVGSHAVARNARERSRTCIPSPRNRRCRFEHHQL